MPFPETERVVYSKNPLRVVICQLRFPTILRIGNEEPAAFQEKVRRQFPLYQEADDEAEQQLPEELAKIIPPELLGLRHHARFQFMTQDSGWIISLTREFVALETSQYTCWEEFRDYVELLLNVLIEIYEPAYLSRIGLRYQNLIDRKALRLEAAPWRDLLADFVLGPLARDETMNSVLEHKNLFLMQLNAEKDRVRIEHGLFIDEAVDASHQMYLLDNDFYTAQERESNVENVLDKLDEFNAQNRRLFKWCIKARLHRAMDPR